LLALQTYTSLPQRQKVDPPPAQKTSQIDNRLLPQAILRMAVASIGEAPTIS
jgi:hypothetical protein